ncbi:MAG: LacI family DNA-binding transcriptional regulator [Chloroflexota bacterium]
MSNIQDVAKHAGVSIATVSRVLNDSAPVKDEVRKRVEAAIEALSYRPNPAARSLRSNKSRIIGLLVSDIQNPFFMGLIRGVEDEALKHEYSVILCNSNESPPRERQYLDVLYMERVAGVIVVPTSENLGEETLRRFRERGVPIIAVDRRVRDPSIDAVLSDSIRGAREAVGHLIANGYRRIGIITGPESVTTGRERLESYRQTLISAGIPTNRELERIGNFTIESGYMLTEQLLDLAPRPDALFIANNMMTLGALNAIHARGLRIPEDVAIVSYDYTQWAVPGPVSLTSVMQPARELGSTAALRLFQRLRNPEISSRQEIILAPTLQIGESSRPIEGSGAVAGVAGMKTKQT